MKYKLEKHNTTNGNEYVLETQKYEFHFYKEGSKWRTDAYDLNSELEIKGWHYEKTLRLSVSHAREFDRPY